MATGGTIALVVGGVVVVGGVAYLIMRKPTALSGANAGLRAVPKSQAAPVGTAAVAIGSGLGGLLTNLFAPSKSAPTTAALQGSSQLAQPPAQSFNNTGQSSSPAVANYLADNTAAADDESGVVGFGGWD